MENLNDITSNFGKLFAPKKAIVFYSAVSDASNEYYLEAMDFGGDGMPINATPLTLRECNNLAKQLNASNKNHRPFLKSKGLLPENILYLNPEEEGFIIWQTPESNSRLFFKKNLGILNGKASIPPLIWKASKNELFIYAIKGENRSKESTILFHAPFFNIYKSGSVCMGDVKIEIESDCCLEDFMAGWERYFFNSYFNHSLYGLSTKTNIVELWRRLIESKDKFPISVLRPNGLTLKDIL